MNFRIFDHLRVRQALTLALLVGALGCMFPPAQPTFQWWAERSFLVALGYLGLGLFFLVINKSRLMFVCFGCSAAICFFKIEAKNLGLGDVSLRSPASVVQSCEAEKGTHKVLNLNLHGLAPTH
jgi:hypothetical protein